jgi:hypothetical protein
MMNMIACWAPMLTCVNSAAAPGQLRQVLSNSTCRNFRARREPARWTEPPTPADDCVRHIALTKGYFATVDAADYEWLSKYKWTALVTGAKVYAIRAEKGKTILMHREIMNAPAGMVVDHIDGNGANNRRTNLRLCTRAQNLYNSKPRASRSQYKGVRFEKRTGKWIAEITHRGKKHYLGAFDNEIEAAHAYDQKARTLFGEFAHLNFPDAPDPAPVPTDP